MSKLYNSIDPCTSLQPTDSKLDVFLTSMGYTHLRDIAGVKCGLMRFNFTYGLLVGLTEDGYNLRYCYEHASDAEEALRLWGRSGHPGGPWIKCKGAGIDLLNPLLDIA